MFGASDTADLPTEQSTVTGTVTMFSAVMSAVILTLTNLLLLRTRKFAARFSVKGSRHAFETLEQEMTLDNARFRGVTAVVVKIMVFRVMIAGYLLSAFRTSRTNNVPEDRDSDCRRNSTQYQYIRRMAHRLDSTAHDHQTA